MTVPWFELLERLSELLSVTCCNGRQVLSFSSAMVVILQHCHSWNIHNLRLTRETPAYDPHNNEKKCFFFLFVATAAFLFSNYERGGATGVFMWIKAVEYLIKWMSYLLELKCQVLWSADINNSLVKTVQTVKIIWCAKPNFLPAAFWSGEQ